VPGSVSGIIRATSSGPGISEVADFTGSASRSADPIPYSGTAPFGACHLQCVANLLAWQNITDAETVLCPTWGFSWSGRMVLKGSGRWVKIIRESYQIDLEEKFYRDFSTAHAAMEESIDQGYPVAATVDAWHLPSPFTGVEHIAHCVLVVASEADHVWIIDPMNRPWPVRYAIPDWERIRSAACTDRFRTFLVTSRPRRMPGTRCLIHRLREDIRASQAADRQCLQGFLAHCEDGGDGPPDVSLVAAERLYLSKLLRRSAQDMPGLTRVADDVLSLARRWYFAHSIGRERAGDSGPSGRAVRLLRELADRELATIERATELLEVAPGRGGEGG